MIVVAPASAGWKTHRAPAFERAVIAVHATDAQAIAARRQLNGAQERLRGVEQRVTTLRQVERAVRASLQTAPAAGIGGAATTLLTVTRERVQVERSRLALQEDIAYSRTLLVKAQQRRAVVLGGLSLQMRQRVLRADRVRQRQARARRAAAREQVLLAPVELTAPAAVGDNGADLARELDGAAAPPAASGSGAIAAAYALTQLGTPYSAAGYSPEQGFDCSGLIYWAFAQAGHDVPRSSWQIWDAGRRIARGAAQPGDIVSFHGQGHVGIYVGDGLYVHSTKAGDVVRVHAIADRNDLDGFVRLG